MDSISSIGSFRNDSAFTFEEMMTELAYEDFFKFHANGSGGNNSLFIRGYSGFDRDELTKGLPFPFGLGGSVDEDEVYRNFIFLGLYVVTFIFGLSGNIFSVCVFFKIKQLGQNASLLLLNLIVSDISVLVCCIPISLIERFKGEWVHGKIACKLVPFVQGCAVVSSIITASLLPLLFVVTHQQMRRLRQLTIRREVMITIGIWVVAAVLTFPLPVFYAHHARNVMGLLKFNICKENWPGRADQNAYNILLLLCTCSVPVVTIIAMLPMCYPFRSSHLSSNIESTEAGLESINHRKKLTRPMLSLLILHFVSWVPYQIIIIYMDMKRSVENLGWLAKYGLPFAQWLVHSIPVIHPLLYCAYIKGYRLLFCKRRGAERLDSELFTRNWYALPSTEGHGHENDSLVIDKVTVL